MTERLSISQYHTSNYAGWWGWCNEWVNLKKHEVCWEVAKSQQVISLSSGRCCCGFSVEHYKVSCPELAGRLSLLPLIFWVGCADTIYIPQLLSKDCLRKILVNTRTFKYDNWLLVELDKC